MAIRIPINVDADQALATTELLRKRTVAYLDEVKEGAKETKKGAQESVESLDKVSGSIQGLIDDSRMLRERMQGFLDVGKGFGRLGTGEVAVFVRNIRKAEQAMVAVRNAAKSLSQIRLNQQQIQLFTGQQQQIAAAFKVTVDGIQVGVKALSEEFRRTGNVSDEALTRTADKLKRSKDLIDRNRQAIKDQAQSFGLSRRAAEEFFKVNTKGLDQQEERLKRASRSFTVLKERVMDARLQVEALGRVRSLSKGLGSQVDTISTGVKTLGLRLRETGKVGTVEFNLLRARIALTTRSVSTQREELVRLAQSAQTVKLREIFLRGARAQDQLLGRLRQSRASLEQVRVAGLRAGAGIAKGTVQARGSVIGLLGSVRTLRGALSTLFIGLGIRKAVTDFIEFRKSINEVRAFSGATRKELEELETTALRTARTTRFTTVDVAKAQAELALRAFDVSQIQEISAQSANLAAASNVTLAKATKIVGATIKQFGFDASDARQITDQLVLTTINSSARLENLGTSLRKVAPIARTAGLEFTEISAALAILSEREIFGEESGTALRNAIARLIAPSKEVRAALTNLLGPDFEDKILKAPGKLRPLTEIFRLFEERGINAAEAVAIFGLRAEKVGNIFAGQSKRIGEFNDQLKETAEASDRFTGAAEKVRDVTEEGLFGAFVKLKSAFSDISTSILKVFEPALTRLFLDIAGGINDISEFIAVFSKSPVIGEAADEVSKFFKTLAPGREALSGTFDNLKTFFGGFPGLLRDAFETSLDVTGIFIGAFEKLVGGDGALGKAFRETSKALDEGLLPSFTEFIALSVKFRLIEDIALKAAIGFQAFRIAVAEAFKGATLGTELFVTVVLRLVATAIEQFGLMSVEIRKSFNVILIGVSRLKLSFDKVTIGIAALFRALGSQLSKPIIQSFADITRSLAKFASDAALALPPGLFVESRKELLELSVGLTVAAGDIEDFGKGLDSAKDIINDARGEIKSLTKVNEIFATQLLDVKNESAGAAEELRQYANGIEFSTEAIKLLDAGQQDAIETIFELKKELDALNKELQETADQEAAVGLAGKKLQVTAEIKALIDKAALNDSIIEAEENLRKQLKFKLSDPVEVPVVARIGLDQIGVDVNKLQEKLTVLFKQTKLAEPVNVQAVITFTSAAAFEGPAGIQELAKQAEAQKTLQDTQLEDLRFHEEAKTEIIRLNEQGRRLSQDITEKNFSERTKQIRKTDEELFKNQRKLQKARQGTLVRGTAALFGSIANISSSAGAKIFKVQKGFAIANAVISTFEGANAALKIGPAGIPLAAAIVLQGLARVRKIKSTQPGGGGGAGAGGGGGGNVSLPSPPVAPIIPVIPLATIPEVASDARIGIRTLQVIIEGNVLGDEEFVRERLAPVLRESIEDNEEFGLRADITRA